MLKVEARALVLSCVCLWTISNSAWGEDVARSSATVEDSKAASAEKGAWRRFTAPDGDFSVMAPVEFASETREVKGMSLRMFNGTQASTGASFSVIANGTGGDFAPYFKGVKDGITDKGGIVTSEEDKSGNGWRGKQVRFKVNGGESALLVAATQGEQAGAAYSLMTNYPYGSPELNKFFDSLVVQPSKAVELYGTSAAQRSEGWSYRLGYMIGTALPVVLIIAGIIFGIRLATRRKAQS